MKAVLRTDAERSRFIAHLERMELPAEVSVEPYRKTRTQQQNSYLFGVAYPLLAEATGYEVDGDNGIHAFMCGTHWGWVDRKVPKTPANPQGVASFPMRTTTRDEEGRRDVVKADEFTKFVETVKRIGAAANVFIPDPGP